MALLPENSDSKSNLLRKIALNIGPIIPEINDSSWNLLYKITENTANASTVAVTGQQITGALG
jgi:hypothetical protein